MSTVNERDALRRALRIADGIEPRGDGLQRIQARLSPPRPLAVAWAEGAWTYARMRGPDELQRVGEWLRSLASFAWEHIGLIRGRLTSSANGWLRPVAVAGVTIFVVAVGTYVAIDGQQVFSPSSSNALHNSGGGSGVGGGGTGKAATNSQSQSPFSRYPSSPSPSPTCTPAKSGSSAAPGPTTGPSSPAASPSGTSSAPSPSSSPTDSSSPAVSPAAASSLSAIRTVADLVVQTSASASPTPQPCTTKRPGHRTSGAGTPNPSPAVFSFAKLDGS